MIDEDHHNGIMDWIEIGNEEESARVILRISGRVVQAIFGTTKSEGFMEN